MCAVYQLMIVILSVLRVSSFTTDWSEEFDYNTYIDENQLFKLYWTDLENDIIEFGIEVSATGWISLGISPNGQMPDSDIAIGWVDDDGNAYLQDRYTTARALPLYDSNQDLTLIEGEEIDGMTRLRWYRPKYTCDDDDISLSKGTTRLIWAFHATDDPDTECFESGSIVFHTNQGSQSLNLDSGIPKEIELEDDIMSFEFTMDNIVVPSTDTTYYCKLFEIPHFNDTHHIVKISTIIEEGNEALVHHMTVYDCPRYIADQDHQFTEGICDDFANMPLIGCTGGKRVLLTWAIGGTKDLYMPINAGTPISGASNTHYIMIEIHYDNQLRESGIIDNSGIEMTLTPTLREMDVGVFRLGTNFNGWGQWIPSGLSNAHFVGFITSECSENAFPDEGIKVFGSLLHQHTAGKAMRHRHIRNGTELAPIDINLNYDFNYQQTILFDEPIIILPGDELILDCWTDTTNRDYVTIGGESALQEMCGAGLYYYPAMDMTLSIVEKMPFALETWMRDAQTAGYMNGTSSDIDAIFANINEIDFESLPISFDSTKDGALEFYNRLYSVEYEEYNIHKVLCLDENRALFNDEIINVARDESFEPYELGLDECDNYINANIEDAGVCEITDKSEMRSIISGWIFVVFVVVWIYMM